MSRLTRLLMDRLALNTLVLSLAKEISAQVNFSLLVVPGGAKGAETLSRNRHVQRLIRDYIEADRYVGMICAG